MATMNCRCGRGLHAGLDVNAFHFNWSPNRIVFIIRCPLYSMHAYGKQRRYFGAISLCPMHDDSKGLKSAVLCALSLSIIRVVFEAEASGGK